MGMPMSWRNRLAGMQSSSGQESPDEALTKPTKGAFGSFGSDPDGHSSANDPAVRDEIRSHLLAFADGEGVDAAYVQRLHADDVAACVGESDETQRTYLRVLERGARMDAGMVPFDWTATANCAGCGPVWWHKAERLTACPWCFKRKAGKVIPRPIVRCGDCRHYSPDPLNHLAGVGGCELGAGRARWPMANHRCAEHDH
jgi:hypothetical protein